MKQRTSSNFAVISAISDEGQIKTGHVSHIHPSDDDNISPGNLLLNLNKGSLFKYLHP